MTAKASLSLHPGQMVVFRSPARFRVVVAGRRWGKTQLAKTLMITRAKKRKSKIWYVAPTYKMAKQIMWTDLLEAVPKQWVRKVNETRLEITLINGTVIELKGADKGDSLRGVGVDFLVMDEFQDINPETWTKVLRPTLADRRGDAVFIGTSKAYNHLYTLYRYGQRGETYLDDKGALRRNVWRSWQFPTITSPFIPMSEIEAARNDMDEKSFRQEFEACHLPETEVRLWNGQVRQMQHVEAGDWVCHLTEAGDVVPCEVIKVGVTGVKQIVDVTLETGEVTSASNHHKFKVHVNE